jgi:hypothetical protein
MKMTLEGEDEELIFMFREEIDVLFVDLYLISDPMREARRITERACALLIFFILSLFIDSK